MKNKIIYIAASLLLGATAMSCREESLISFGGGEGKMTLSTSVMSDIRVVSRALDNGENNSLANTTRVWISDADNKVIHRYYGVVGQAEELTLQSGTYYAEGWVGDSIPAFGAWEEERGTGKRYHAREMFEIVNGQTTPVKLVCIVRNTLVSINLDENTERVLKDINFEVSLNDGITDGSHSVTFEGEHLGEKAYFMPNTRTHGFAWTLSGTDIQGNRYSRSGVYKDAEATDSTDLARATEYIFNIKYDINQGDIEIGGAYFNIDVVPEPVEGTTEEIIIALPPEIIGMNGYDISRPILGAPGALSRKSIHVIGSSPLTSVKIEGKILEDTYGYFDYDLLKMDASYIDELAAKGINFITYDKLHEEDSEEPFVPTNLRLNLEEEFLNSLQLGEHSLTITATDEGGNTSTSVIQFNISEAPGQLIETDNDKDVDYTSAHLSAEVTKPGKIMGFEVMVNTASRAYENWSFVEGVLDGDKLTADTKGLENDTEYLCRLVVDDFRSAEMSFRTKAYPQLPNAGFEEWYKGPAKYSGKDGTYVPCAVADLEARYWDSGNHGSMKMSINVTQPDETVKHSGKYSIRLRSDYPSLVGIGRFAAGNVFSGEYLKTDGTDGELGWGRPFESPARPKALEGYVKYTPVAVDRTESAGEKFIKKGDMDMGIIYIALLSGDLETYSSSSSWPVIIKTKSTKLFDKNAANVVAYGEYVLEGATPGNDMIKFRIPLEDVHGDLDVKNIMVIASASRYGDYFTGGVGSTLWLDDLKLIY